MEAEIEVMISKTAYYTPLKIKKVLLVLTSLGFMFYYSW